MDLKTKEEADELFLEFCKKNKHLLDGAGFGGRRHEILANNDDFMQVLVDHGYLIRDGWEMNKQLRLLGRFTFTPDGELFLSMVKL